MLKRAIEILTTRVSLANAARLLMVPLFAAMAIGSVVHAWSAQYRNAGDNGTSVGMVIECANAQGQAAPCAGGGAVSNQLGYAPTAGTFATVLPASSARKGCLIQNNSASLGYVFFGATASATLTNTFQVQGSGGSIPCAQPGAVLQDNVASTCASGTCAFVVNNY